MAISTYIQPLERQRWFRDRDGVLSTSKSKNDVLQLTVDWTDELGGTTISSVAYVDSGLVTSAKSNTTTTTTVDLTGIGETEITLTLASGHKLVRKIRGYDLDNLRPRDYRR